MGWSGSWQSVSRGMGFAVLLALSPPSVAQVIWDMPSVIVPKTKFDDSKVPVRPDAWPRLDPGAVICRTEADLLRLAASRRGEAGDRPNCQVIRAATPIQILHRGGPGRTQVALADQKGEGWTDAWLPEKAPAVGGRGVSIR